MVKIRLRRVGSKKQPSFRLVVADSRAPRDGRFIEEIGFYNPRTEPETLRIQEERALHWLSVGAQPTDSAERLLKTWGTLARFDRLREGESLEALLAEAEAEVEAEAEAEEAPAVEAPEAEQEGTEAPSAETEPDESSATEEAELQDLETEEPTAASGAEEAAESQETEEAPEEDKPLE